MSNKWQIIVLGAVIAQGAGLSAMENKATNPLKNSCGAEARQEPVMVKALLEKKQSLDNLRKEEKAVQNDTSNVFHPWPGATRVYESERGHYNPRDYMKPWCPDSFFR